MNLTIRDIDQLRHSYIGGEGEKMSLATPSTQVVMEERLSKFAGVPFISLLSRFVQLKWSYCIYLMIHGWISMLMRSSRTLKHSVKHKKERYRFGRVRSRLWSAGGNMRREEGVQ